MWLFHMRFSQRWLWIFLIFWEIAPCSPLNVNRRFKETYRPHLQSQKVSHTINQHEAGGKQSKPEFSADFHQTTRRYIPEEIILSVSMIAWNFVNLKSILSCDQHCLKLRSKISWQCYAMINFLGIIYVPNLYLKRRFETKLSLHR
jgi:hypothetical protein